MNYHPSRVANPRNCSRLFRTPHQEKRLLRAVYSMRDIKPNFLNQTDAIVKFAFEKAWILESERPAKSKICNLNLLLLLLLLLFLFLSIQLLKISEDLESTTQFNVFFKEVAATEANIQHGGNISITIFVRQVTDRQISTVLVVIKLIFFLNFKDNKFKPTWSCNW